MSVMGINTIQIKKAGISSLLDKEYLLRAHVEVYDMLK